MSLIQYIQAMVVFEVFGKHLCLHNFLFFFIISMFPNTRIGDYTVIAARLLWNRVGSKT